MGVMGTLLKNRRAGEAKLAWNLPNLSAPETLVLTSDAFADGGDPSRARREAGRRQEPVPPAVLERAAGGDRGTAAGRRGHRRPDAAAVRALRGADRAAGPRAADWRAGGQEPGCGGTRAALRYGTGYLGPEPIKGHGPHRYTFQLFAWPPLLLPSAALLLDSHFPLPGLCRPGPARHRA